MISYCNGVFMNMIFDDELIKDGDVIKGFFCDELKDLASQYGLPNKDSDIFLPVTHTGAVLSAVM